MEIWNYDPKHRERVEMCKHEIFRIVVVIIVLRNTSSPYLPQLGLLGLPNLESSLSRPPLSASAITASLGPRE